MNKPSPYISISLSDELMTMLALEWIMRNVGEDGTLGFNEPGVANGFLKLRSVSPGDLRKIAHHARDSLSIRIDREKLSNAIYAASADSQKADNLSFLLKNGATRSMISDVLGVTDARIDRARDQLGVSAAPRGRPQMPSVFEREQIIQAWAGSAGVADVERFRRLKEKFPKWNLRSLSATVNEFGRELEASIQTSSVKAQY